MASDPIAKAIRAAEWFTAQGWDVRHRDERWRAYPPGYATGDESALSEDFAGSDRLLIAFAEDRGWQDQDQEAEPYSMQNLTNPHKAHEHEADGVEWHVGSEWATVNGHTIAIECGQGLFTWVVFQDGEPGVTARSNPVTPPHTLAEARRQAVEAARGMG